MDMMNTLKVVAPLLMTVVLITLSVRRVGNVRVPVRAGTVGVVYILVTAVAVLVMIRDPLMTGWVIVCVGLLGALALLRLVV
jgi:hypothetical protein